MTNDKETTDKEIIEDWFTRARTVQSPDDLNALMKNMMEYDYDYGTIVCRRSHRGDMVHGQFTNV